MKIHAEHASCLAFHPTADQFVIGTLGGDIYRYVYAHNDDQDIDEAQSAGGLPAIGQDVCVSPAEDEAGKIRFLVYSPSGTRLACGYSEGLVQVHSSCTLTPCAVFRAECGVVIGRWLNENILCVGTDDGMLEVWSVGSTSERIPAARLAIHETNPDGAINDIAAERNMVWAAVDGNLFVFQAKPALKLLAVSDEQENDLLSLSVVGDNLCCAMGDEYLGLFRFGDWGDIKERITDQMGRVTALSSATEDGLLLAADDRGDVWAVSVTPPKVLCLVGSRSRDENGEPDGIDSVAIARSERFFATLSLGTDIVELHPLELRKSHSRDPDPGFYDDL